MDFQLKCLRLLLVVGHGSSDSSGHFRVFWLKVGERLVNEGMSYSKVRKIPLRKERQMS